MILLFLHLQLIVLFIKTKYKSNQISVLLKYLKKNSKIPLRTK